MADWLEEIIKERQRKGESIEKIRADLLEDLEEGGSVFKEFREFIKPTFPNSKRRFKDLGTLTNKARWSSVLLKDTCLDCRALHGQVKTWEEWEKTGLPRKRKTQCGKECKCVLITLHEKEMP